MPRNSTADLILDVAQELVQTRGYNAFSYGDLAKQIGIKTASIHYHFPSKADLGRVMVQRYRAMFAQKLRHICQHAPDQPDTQLRAYASVYRSVLATGRLCLCGMLSADYATLPFEIQTEVIGFFDDNTQWIMEALKQGESLHLWQGTDMPETEARFIISTVQGAMLATRGTDQMPQYDNVIALLLRKYVGSHTP